jgi:hypothetical protein
VVFSLCSWCSAITFGGSFDDGGPCSADEFVLFPVACDLFFGSFGWICFVRAGGWLLCGVAVLVVVAYLDCWWCLQPVFLPCWLFCLSFLFVTVCVQDWVVELLASFTMVWFQKPERVWFC